LIIGKPLARDVTMPGMFTDWHIGDNATESAAPAAANKAAVNKIAKYGELENICIFFPVAIETTSAWPLS